MSFDKLVSDTKLTNVNKYYSLSPAGEITTSNVKTQSVDACFQALVQSLEKLQNTGIRTQQYYQRQIGQNIQEFKNMFDRRTSQTGWKIKRAFHDFLHFFKSSHVNPLRQREEEILRNVESVQRTLKTIEASVIPAKACKVVNFNAKRHDEGVYLFNPTANPSTESLVRRNEYQISITTEEDLSKYYELINNQNHVIGKLVIISIPNKKFTIDELKRLDDLQKNGKLENYRFRSYAYVEPDKFTEQQKAFFIERFPNAAKMDLSTVSGLHLISSSFVAIEFNNSLTKIKLANFILNSNLQQSCLSYNLSKTNFPSLELTLGNIETILLDVEAKDLFKIRALKLALVLEDKFSQNIFNPPENVECKEQIEQDFVGRLIAMYAFIKNNPKLSNDQNLNYLTSWIKNRLESKDCTSLHLRNNRGYLEQYKLRDILKLIPIKENAELNEHENERAAQLLQAEEASLAVARQIQDQASMDLIRQLGENGQLDLPEDFEVEEEEEDFENEVGELENDGVNNLRGDGFPEYEEAAFERSVDNGGFPPYDPAAFGEG